MIKIVCKLFVLLIVSVSLNCFAQNTNQIKDSVLVSRITTGFFNWYIKSAKLKKQAEYNPIEVADKNGMTTLDFTKYMKNLKKHSFSDSLMERERMTYVECVQKLSKIKYTDYLKLTDLSAFEKLEDDFTNQYRWTGGQEMCDGYAVSSIEYTKQGAVVYGRLYYMDATSNENSREEVYTVFIKQNNVWKILDIR